jgi:uncharacterized protein with HEPN domain
MIADRDRVLVNHILDAADAIDRFVANCSLVDFSENDLIQSAVVKKFEIIGEAANRLSKEFKVAYPASNWKDIIGMRNILIHDYGGIDYESVWNTIELHLPQLKAELEQFRFTEAEKQAL